MKRTSSHDDEEENVSNKRQNSNVTRNRELTTVLVKNLPKSYNQTKIRKFFQDCGQIKYIDIADSLDKSARFARIEFAKYDETLTALTKTFKMVGTNEIEVVALKDCTLWITNYPPQYGVKDLKAMFTDIGLVALSVRLPSLRFNTSRRFAYVDVCSNEEAKKAVNMLNNLEIENHKLIVKISNPLEKSARTDAASVERRELFIRNIDPNTTTEASLNELFSKFGDVEKVNIPKSPGHTINGCAFVTFKTKEDANKALVLNGTHVGSHEISVNLADQKAYLERNEVKRVLGLKACEEYDRILSLYPISDRVSKAQILQLILDATDISKTDIEKIYLVNDYKGALVCFKNKTISAKCMLFLDKLNFQNKHIFCGQIKDLKKYRSSIEHSTNNLTEVKKNQKISQMGPTEVERKDLCTQENMSNDDFRKLFLGG